MAVAQYTALVVENLPLLEFVWYREQVKSLLTNVNLMIISVAKLWN